MADLLIDRVKEVLQENEISVYQMEDTCTEGAELYFIRKHMDMRRMKKVRHTAVTVYRDFEKDGTKCRGYAEVTVAAHMSKEELSQKIKDAYFAASFITNPWYELAEGRYEEPVVVESTLAALSLQDVALKLAEALYAADTEEDTFVNSAEIFVEKSVKRIWNSNGIDVGYTKYRTNGEFVAQCITPQDVETYQSFSYDELELESLTKKVQETLQMTKDRAKATNAPKAGEYRLILSNQNVASIVSYYLSRSSSGMIYPKYSNYEVGTKVQGEEVTGDKLTLTLVADVPYSSEGIKMKDRLLLDNSELKLIHGGNRMARYMGIEATGFYGKHRMEAGSVSLEDMKKEPYLHVVNFSDFQMDAYSGYFGGEIRLGYLFDGEKVSLVTGGSVNGSILELGKDMKFSKEMQKEAGFEGPYAVCIDKVSVAGE